jgi:heparanase 1
MRWTNFADSHWYLDAMGVKAASGYSAFCRQDFVGIDYGMIDCSTYQPLPDYYSGILWSRLMGTRVLTASSSDPTLRAYAHCGADHAPPAPVVTVLLINLDPTTHRVVTLEGVTISQQQQQQQQERAPSGGSSMMMQEWHLTGPNGTASTQMALNGQLLVASVGAGGTEYELPSLAGRNTSLPSNAQPVVVDMAPASIAFVQLPASTGVCRDSDR